MRKFNTALRGEWAQARAAHTDNAAAVEARVCSETPSKVRRRLESRSNAAEPAAFPAARCGPDKRRLRTGGTENGLRGHGTGVTHVVCKDSGRLSANSQPAAGHAGPQPTDGRSRTRASDPGVGRPRLLAAAAGRGPGRPRGVREAFRRFLPFLFPVNCLPFATP